MIAFLFMNFDGHMASFRITNIYAWMLDVNIESNWFHRRFISYGETISAHRHERCVTKTLFIPFFFFFCVLRTRTGRRNRSRCRCRSCETFSLCFPPTCIIQITVTLKSLFFGRQFDFSDLIFSVIRLECQIKFVYICMYMEKFI